jgi:hypothetical protein
LSRKKFRRKGTEIYNGNLPACGRGRVVFFPELLISFESAVFFWNMLFSFGIGLAPRREMG